MHPEVRRKGPGDCPRCGMALEPVGVVVGGVEPGASRVEEAEARAWRLRTWVAAALTFPLLVLSMGADWVGHPHWIAGGEARWLQLLLAAPVVGGAGLPLLRKAVTSLRHLSPNMFTLIGLGVAAAFGTSLAALLAPGSFPASSLAHGGRAPLYFEAAAVITTLVLLGQWLEARARGRTGEALRLLVGLAPARVIRLPEDREIDLTEVARGDRLRVRPGERVPVDGVVIEGASDVDESLVTGEATPVAKGPGTFVTGGTLNGRGSFVMRAEKVGADTFLARMVALVAQAQRSKAPIQDLADQVSESFVPAVVAIAGLAFAAWWFLGPEPRWAHALVNSVAVLVIACPCALGLATPMTVMVALGKGASAGVLIRDARALQALAEVTTLVIDKTGTLTEGKPSVVEIAASRGASNDDVLRAMAALEEASEHPLAGAVLRAARDRGLEWGKVEPDSFQSVTGQGVSGRLNGALARAGTREFTGGSSGDDSALAAAARWRTEGRTALFVSWKNGGSEFYGAVAVEDRVRPSASKALTELRGLGVRVILASGDHEATVRAVGRGLAFTEEDTRFEVSPAGKLDLVRGLQTSGTKVAMAGDGINDAPALAQADVGIALASGTGVAIESAAVTLVGGDLTGILRALRLGRAALRNARQNLIFAFAYNAIGIPVAAGVLYPWFGWLLNPMLAGAAMSLSSASVIANALRLRRARV